MHFAWILLLLPLAFQPLSAFPQNANTLAADFSKWQKPRAGDVRSPCPGLNSLANHGLLPRSGKGITLERLAYALSKVTVARDVAEFTFGAAARLGMVKDGKLGLDALNERNKIEHDASLSRSDAAVTGDGHSFDRDVFESYMESFGDADTVTLAMASEARFARIEESKKINPEFAFDARRDFQSKGETILAVGVIGGFDKLQAPVSQLRIFFGRPA